MTDQSMPGELRSNDGLGPLPEYAHEFRPRWPGDDGGFTDAQMRLYALDAVAAERERCAKLCEAVHADTGECPELALYCAERIRGPNRAMIGEIK